MFNNYCLSLVVEYALMGGYVFVFNSIFHYFENELTPNSMVIGTLSSLVFVWVREEIWFVILGEQVAEIKRKYERTWVNWAYVFQTIGIGITNQLILTWCGLLYYTPITLSVETFVEVILVFYILQILKDVTSLVTFHEWMHTDKAWMKYHTTHHVVGRNAQALLALHIDALDLVFENTCGILVYLGVLYMLGLQVRAHYALIYIGGFMDVHLHSVNPYSVCLWNPLLDHVFRCNVAHQIHHACLTKNYTFIPYHHIFSSRREKDLKQYNTIMKTNFKFL